jgi:hypothetical protein
MEKSGVKGVEKCLQQHTQRPRVLENAMSGLLAMDTPAKKVPTGVFTRGSTATASPGTGLYAVVSGVAAARGIASLTEIGRR